MAGLGLNLIGEYIINTPRKFLIWAILFFIFFLIFGFNQSYFCKIFNIDYKDCFVSLFLLAFILAIVLSLVIVWTCKKFRKKK
jgi:uncharacterized membrane protein